MLRVHHNRTDRCTVPATATMMWLVVLTTSTLNAQESRFIARRTDGGIEVRESGKPVLFFQTKMKSLDGKWPRANYVHPFYGLDGQVLTEDFPDDHRHHRGVFWAWHQLLWHGQKMGDPWLCQGIEWLPPDSESDGIRTAEDDEQATVCVIRDWAVHLEGGIVHRLVKEDVKVRVQRSEPKYRAVDFTIRLLALEPGVAIGGSDDEKGYGGFSPRIRLPDDITFVGQTGPVEPRATPVDCGAWMRCTATIDDKATGLTVMCHPSNPDSPPCWILRNKNSMQNVAWPGREPVVLSTEAPTVLRYRLLIDRGNLNREEIGKNYKSFSVWE